MLTKLEGTVASYKAISTNCVQLKLDGIRPVIELTISEPWVINKGDVIVVAGEDDEETGKFIGYAYINVSEGVVGEYDPVAAGGYLFLITASAAKSVPEPYLWRLHVLLVLVCGGFVCLFFNGLVGMLMLSAGVLMAGLGFKKSKRVEAAYIKRLENALRCVFEPSTELVGKNIRYIIDKAGVPSHFGSMDYGTDVAQWKVGTVVVEAWFQDGVCTEVRPIRK